MFENCSSLEYVEIGDGVNSIGGNSFKNCGNLGEVIIPKSVTFIYESTFSGCEKLTSVYYKGMEEEWKEMVIKSSENSDLLNATLYYYSETQPTADGNWWHYGNGEVVVWD